MNLDSEPFRSLSFSKLFNNYIQREESVKAFFELDPFDDSEVFSHLQSFKFTGDRKKTVSWLTDFHSGYKISEQSAASIKKIESSDSLVVVTGQQCTIFGGPLFTVYKIITAIEKARIWQEKLNRPVIPVFWIADEDHDFDEASEIAVQTRDDLSTVVYRDHSETGKRVAEIEFSDEILRLKRELKNQLIESDFSDQLWKLLNHSYKKGNTFGKAFGQLILDLFGKYGLILAGSATKISKELTADTMVKSVSCYQQLHDALSSQSHKLSDAGFKNQVHLNKSNLFYIDEGQIRKKIQFEDKKWAVADSQISWSSEELIKKIQDSPHKFSPNVFLRPILQDTLLPVVSYVGGPGEIAYYAQMKSFYRTFNMKMPIITPRFSATIVESGINRIMKKLPFSLSEYAHRIEDLESEYIDKTDSPDVEKIFGIWRQQVKEASENSVKQISDIDPTLRKSADKTISVFFNELDRLKGKLYKSLKNSENVQISRIEKIKLNLFPARNLQEREIAFIYFMNKYGTGIWDNLIDELKSEIPDSHKIIYL